MTTETQRTINAQQAAEPVNAAGLKRPGTVQIYNASSRIATVLVDGDRYPTDIENLLSIVLLVGTRVMVEYQNPAGAFVVGLCSDQSENLDITISQVIGLQTQLTTLDETQTWGQSFYRTTTTSISPSSTVTYNLYSNAGSGWQAPEAGLMLVNVVVSCNTSVGGIQQADVYANNQLNGSGLFSARSGAGGDICFFSIPCQWNYVVTAGATWSPRITIQNGAGVANLEMEFIYTHLIFIPTPKSIVAV